MKNTTSDDKKTRIHAQTGHFFLGKSFMINFSTQYSGETLRLFFLKPETLLAGKKLGGLMRAATKAAKTQRRTQR